LSSELRTLVIGGSGPTGPYIVQGLLERGHRVTIFHGGQHKVDLGTDVEHLHGDPHFKDSLEDLIAGRGYDVVVATTADYLLRARSSDTEPTISSRSAPTSVGLRHARIPSGDFQVAQR
jgi:nucleoside-diphosphate-sugar epimerase